MQLNYDQEFLELIPETQKDKEALHNIQYRRIKSIQLLDISKPTEKLKITLGEDYIAKHYASHPR
jgi:hypothetical protein